MWSGSGWRRTSSSSRRRRSEMDRLEEIRKRDAQEIEAADMWIHHYTACADRRWLLGEVERLQERIQHKLEEEAAYLDTIRQYAETRDQYAAEVEDRKSVV